MVAVDIPEDPLVQLDAYLELEGPFSEQFRNSDSTWSLATEQELEAGLEWWRGMLDRGEAEGWLADREATRAKIGQTSAITSIKC